MQIGSFTRDEIFDPGLHYTSSLGLARANVSLVRLQIVSSNRLLSSLLCPTLISFRKFIDEIAHHVYAPTRIVSIKVLKLSNPGKAHIFLYWRSPGYNVEQFISQRLHRRVQSWLLTRIAVSTYRQYKAFRSSWSSTGSDLGKENVGNRPPRSPFPFDGG